MALIRKVNGNLKIITPFKLSGGSPTTGYKISLLYYQQSNDYDIHFILNGVDNRIDVTQDGKSWYKFPPMENINTISIDADHFGSPFSVSDSWFRIRPVDSSEWHNLTKFEEYTLTSDCEMEFGFGSCLLKGTLITMANGKTKPIEDIKLGDKILDMNGKSSKVIKCQYGEELYDNEWDEWWFSTGYRVKTTMRHRFFNVEHNCWMYLDEWKLGEHALTIDGNKVELLLHKHHNEKAQHFTIWTETNRYYANGLLSGNRHSKLEG